MDMREYVSCGLCGALTPMLGTKRCDACWDLQRRVEANPVLARQVLARLDGRVVITKDGAAAIDPDYYWRELPAPHGVKLQLLTVHGIAVYDKWKPTDTDIAAWAPLPKKRKPMP